MTNSIDIFKELGVISEENTDLEFVDTGSYALNKVISGRYNGGIPLRRITEFYGKSSTAKTVFLINILVNAQKKGYFTVLADTENTLSSQFATVCGLDPKKLVYRTPETVEDTFEQLEKIIERIREVDKDTPIILGIDSIAVLPSRAEYQKETIEDKYKNSNTDGAIRAKAVGSALRKFNPILKKTNTTLIVINQLRSKINVMYGNPQTKASGGQSLDYYLSVSLETKSGKSDVITLDKTEKPIGIRGKVENTKNKASIPFLDCEFELYFNKGLTKEYGLVTLLEQDGLITRSGAWYTLNSNGFKFQSTNFIEYLTSKPEFEEIRKLLS